MPQPAAAREVEVEVLPKGSTGFGRHPVTGKDDPLVALVARLMDTLFTIPGTKIRVGLDPLIGLIPALGLAGFRCSAVPGSHPRTFSGVSQCRDVLGVSR